MSATRADAYAIFSPFVASSIDLRAGSADDVRPFRQLALNELRECFGRLAGRLETLGEQALPQVGAAERLLQRRAQTLEAPARRPRRREQAEPGVGLVSRHAGLGDRRQVANQRGSLRSAD